MSAKSRFWGRAIENWPAKIIALGLAIVVVILNNLSQVGERDFIVPLELRLSESVVPGEEYPNRVRIRLRGNEDEIFEIEENDILAYADFSEHATDGLYREPILIERRGTALDAEALEITIEPMNVTVQLAEKLVKSVEIAANIVGFPPPGYELSDYRISPTNVTIEGPRSRIDNVTQVLTEAIDLSGRTDDFTESIRLTRPDPLVRFPGGTVVDFRALIAESVVQRVYDSVDISVLDLDPSLTVSSPIPSGLIRVQGRQLDLDTVASDRIGLVVDASRITEPGTYQVAVRPQIPPGLVVLSIQPSQIEITVDGEDEQ
ncbi:MAG: YbbR-like domain-containing protein [Spirochaetales bacterium]